MFGIAKTGSICVLALALIVSVAISASTEIPAKINYQKLSDSETGEPLVGPQTMTFRLFDDPSTGSLLWTESGYVAADSAGIFSVILGGVNPIDLSFEGPVWLEVEIGGEVLAPRRELVSVPYAFHAKSADSAGRAEEAGIAYLAQNSDSLGGHSFGEFVLEGETAVITSEMIVGGAGSGLNADMLDSLHADAFADTEHHHDERYYLQDSLSAGGTINDGANPVDWSRLKNVPAGFADGTDDGGGGVGDGHSLDASDGDPGDALYVDAEGDIGIGTATPAARLDVAGTVRMEGFNLPSGADSGHVLTSDAEGFGTWRASPVYADTGHGHQDLYYSQSELNTSDGDDPNTGSNRVSWDNLTDVPAGFADGADEVGGSGDGHSLDASDGDPGDALYVDNQGEVGIGTTAPDQALHIFRDSDSPVEVVIENPNTGANSAERLSFGDEDGRVAGIAMFDKASSLYPSQMVIHNDRPDGTINLWVEGLSIMTLKDGRLGVRETDPFHTLDVNGTVGMTGFEMPTGASTGYVLTSDIDGTGNWQPAAVGDGHSLDAADGAPVDALYVSNSGSVGIGTTAPVEKLHLDGQNSDESFMRFTHDGIGSTANDGLAIGIDSGGDVRFWNSEPGELSFGTDAALGMKIDRDGRVGIGTGFPSQKLQVEESGSVWAWIRATGTDGIAGLQVSNDAGFWQMDVRGDLNDALVIRDNTPGTDRVAVTQTGRVGIGTTDPEELLHLDGGPTIWCFTQFTHNGTGSTSNDGLLVGIDDNGDAKFMNNEARYLSLGTDAAERLRITSDGDVGIGIGNPQTSLHLHQTEVAKSGFMRFSVPATGVGITDGMNFGLDSSGWAYIWNYENQPMRFATNGLERLRITSDGKIGIAEETPEVRLELSGGQRIMGPATWPTTGEGLELNYNDSADRGFVQVFDRNGGTWGELSLGASMVGIGLIDPTEMLEIKGNDPFLALNTTNNKTGLKLQKNGTTNWEMAWNEGSGYLYFYNAATRMVIEDATGEVGIGTATPGYKLDVAGAAHASSFPTSSDARFKENVEQLTGVLDRLERVRGVRFDWNSRYESLGRSTGHREIGVIAQEIEEEFPELVTTWGEDDYRAVDYGRMAGVFIEAIKELRAENEDLRDRIEALEQSTD